MPPISLHPLLFVEKNSPVDPDTFILDAHIRTALVRLPQLDQVRLLRHLHHRRPLQPRHEQPPHLKPANASNQIKSNHCQRDVHDKQEKLRMTKKQRNVQPVVHKVRSHGDPLLKNLPGKDS